MRIRLLLAALSVVAAAAVLSAQAFDLRLGQWEYTISGLQIPAAQLAKMPPASRAQAEVMMKQGITSRDCLTAQDLKEMNLATGAADDECKVTSKKVTGPVADVTVACKGDDGPYTQTVHYEALSRESIRADIKRTGGPGPTDAKITGKWITAACKE